MKRFLLLLALLAACVCLARAQFSTAYVTGGASLTGSEVAPQLTAGYSFSLGEFVDIGAQFEYNSVEHEDMSEHHPFRGRHDVFAYYGTLDVWFLNLEAMRLGAYVAPGYATTRIRGGYYDDYRYEGFAGKLGLRGQVVLYGNLSLLVALGGQLLPKYEDWNHEASKFGGFAQVGLAATF